MALFPENTHSETTPLGNLNAVFCWLNSIGRVYMTKWQYMTVHDNRIKVRLIQLQKRMWGQSSYYTETHFISIVNQLTGFYNWALASIKLNPLSANPTKWLNTLKQLAHKWLTFLEYFARHFSCMKNGLWNFLIFSKLLIKKQKDQVKLSFQRHYAKYIHI